MKPFNSNQSPDPHKEDDRPVNFVLLFLFWLGFFLLTLSVLLALMIPSSPLDSISWPQPLSPTPSHHSSIHTHSVSLDNIRDVERPSRDQALNSTLGLTLYFHHH